MILDVAAQNASLANDYGATKGPNAPSSFELALFSGDPAGGGRELTSAGGYVRLVVANNGTNFPAPAGGQVTSASLAMASSTSAWSDTATHFLLFDHADSTTRWDSGPLAQEQTVTVAGTVVEVSVAIYYDNEGA